MMKKSSNNDVESTHVVSDNIVQDIEVTWLTFIETQLSLWLPREAAIYCAKASTDFPIPAAEKAIVANAVLSRKAEFIAGRWCAHMAIEKIGFPAPLIPVDALYGPIWPNDVVGSIAHESGLCLAVATPFSVAKGIGVDIFDARRKKEMDDISDLILTKEEIEQRDAYIDSDLFTQITFSAKEAVVKAISKITGRFLDMREIQLSIKAESFKATLNGFNDAINGRWAQFGPILLTFAIILK